MINTFRALKSPNYRLFIAGQSVSLIGTWMQRTALSWIVYTLTHSSFLLGLILFAGQFPSFLLSLLGGVVSDRYDRYKVLLTTQIASLIQASLLTLLVFLNHYRIWEMMVLSVVLGIINAFDVPARQALVYEMVEDKEDLPNALALNSSMVNFTRIIGPAVAGIVLKELGDSMCFFLNAFSFIAVIASLLKMKLPPYVKKLHPKNMVSELKEGWIYLRHTPSIFFVILMLGTVSLLVLPFYTLVPVYAKVIFKGDARTFGIIDGLIGLGAFLSAIFLASLKKKTNLRTILVTNTFVFGIGLALFSYETFLPLALLFAAISGFGMMSQMTISNTLIQTSVAPHMRGRVISFYAMAYFGMLPIGGLLIGWLASLVGTQLTILLEGIIALILGLIHLAFLRQERKWLAAETEHMPLPIIPGE